jgi:hypothetical protein
VTRVEPLGRGVTGKEARQYHRTPNIFVSVVVVVIEQRVGALVSILTVESLLRKGNEQAIISSH